MSLLKSYFNHEPPPSEHGVALFAGGAEIRARGYARQYVKRGGWVFDGDTAVATVRFGPFLEPVTFDRSVIMAGSTRLSESDEGPVTLRTGMWHEIQLRVVMDVG